MIRALLAAILLPFLLADAPPARPMLPKWWLPTAGSGWIALAPSADEPHLVIPVTINGQAGWAVVDTGFEGMFLSKRYADAHGLPLRPFEQAKASVARQRPTSRRACRWRSARCTPKRLLRSL